MNAKNYLKTDTVAFSIMIVAGLLTLLLGAANPDLDLNTSPSVNSAAQLASKKADDSAIVVTATRLVKPLA